MRTIVKPRFVIMLIATISLIVAISCIKEDIPAEDTGVTLELSATELEGLNLIDNSGTPFSAVITLEDENGNEIISNQALTFTKTGETFVSTNLSIDPGLYHLQEFKVNPNMLKSANQSSRKYVFSYPTDKPGKRFFKIVRFYRKMLRLMLREHDGECDGGHYECGECDDCNGCGGCDDCDGCGGCPGNGNGNGEDPPGEGCETAFAYSADSLCFLNDDDLTTNRWGWTIPVDSASNTDSTHYDIYAAAGQCNLANGTDVGTLTIVYDGDSVTVIYQLDSPFSLDEAHVYAGPEKYPRGNNNEFTVAPGQYNIVEEGLSGDFFEVKIGEDKDGNPLNGSIYVIAHAVVCGFEDENP